MKKDIGIYEQGLQRQKASLSTRFQNVFNVQKVKVHKEAGVLCESRYICPCKTFALNRLEANYLVKQNKNLTPLII